MDRELERRKSRGTRILLVALIVWGLAVAVATEAGIFRAVYPLLLAPIIALGVVVPVIVYALSDGFRTYIEAIGLRPLTAFHIWRIPAALLFFWYGAHDLLPEAFVRNAGWGDLINDPRMSAIATLPMALIPLYGVGISGASHIMAFDLLRRHTGLEPKVTRAAAAKT
jgi:hypothetical protein